jgi:hypothetical protein
MAHVIALALASITTSLVLVGFYASDAKHRARHTYNRKAIR